MAIPTTPVVFFKLTTSIIGPGEPIVLPKNSDRARLRSRVRLRHRQGRLPHSGVGLARARLRLHHRQRRQRARCAVRSTSQWSMGKSFPTFCPLGPAIVTADEIADPHQFAIGLSIDGEQLQNSNTRELVFKIPDLDRVSLVHHSAAAGRYCLHRHATRRRPGPQPQALAQARRDRHGHRRRAGLPHQPCGGRVKPTLHP